jgi:O-antigen ligase
VARLHPPTLPLRPERGTPLVVTGAAALAAVIAGLMVVDLKVGLEALGALVIVPIAFLRIQLTVCIWIVLTFFSSVSGMSSVTNRVLILILICWLGLLANRRVQLRRPVGESRVVIGLAVVFIVWEVLTLAWAPVPHAASVDVRDLLYCGLVLLIVINTATETKYARWYATAFVVGATLTVLYGVAKGGLSAGGATAVTDAEGRLIAGQGDPNYLASVLVPAMILAGAVALGSSRLRRTCLALADVVLAVGLAATQSRGGLLAAAVVALGALLIWRGRRIAIGALIVLAVGGTVGYFAASPAALHRIEMSNSGSGRTDIWQIAWRVVHAHPFFGVGLAQFPQVAQHYVLQSGSLDYVSLIVDKQIVVHNLYLQLWTETGIVGLLIFIALLAVSLTAGWRATGLFESQGDRQMLGLSRCALLGLLGILAANFFLSDIGNRQLWLLVALCTALAGIAERRRRAAAANIAPRSRLLFEDVPVGEPVALPVRLRTSLGTSGTAPA